LGFRFVFFAGVRLADVLAVCPARRDASPVGLLRPVGLLCLPEDCFAPRAASLAGSPAAVFLRDRSVGGWRRVSPGDRDPDPAREAALRNDDDDSERRALPRLGFFRDRPLVAALLPLSSSSSSSAPVGLLLLPLPLL